MNTQPDHALLDEYGLNQVTYRLLAAIATPPPLSASERGPGGEVSWPALKTIALQQKITGNPAPALRKLVERGLLAGPARDEDIHARPFTLTPQGHDIFVRIQLGWHKPQWLTVSRVNALKTLIKANGALLYSPKIHGRKFNRSVLDTLVKHGYLIRDFETYRLTLLGRAAWAEYQQQLLSSPGGKGEKGQ
ncbi:MAG: hypothetical protein L6R45_29645 [Anaerolineae bacterium]|nr:hypothetical protein [Anaerolineae bacterium]